MGLSSFLRFTGAALFQRVPEMGCLEANRLFSALEPSELRRLQESSEERIFQPGAQIFHEGDQGDGLYLVSEGVVQVSALVSANERRVLSKIKAGDFFGEMSVLDGEPRSATATAEVLTKTLFIRREEMLAMIERSPRLAISLVREFSQRMREFNRRYVQEVLQAERLSVVGRFARSIVHDFKNPLHIISLAAELVQMEKVSPEMRKTAAERIRKQVDRLNNMVSELLEFTRGPRRDTVLAAHSYAKFVTGVLGELRQEIEDKGVKIVLRNEPPDIPVPLDPKRMLHVFSNLLHNAVDALEGKGEIRVSFQTTPSEVVTEIEDTGRGIAPEMVARLFEAFATFGKAKGSGLGLSICKKIVEDHGGWIRARNQAGAGAVFGFGLPIAPQS
jgi:signal transduction histidine kinase